MDIEFSTCNPADARTRMEQVMDAELNKENIDFVVDCVTKGYARVGDPKMYHNNLMISPQEACPSDVLFKLQSLKWNYKSKSIIPE